MGVNRTPLNTLSVNMTILVYVFYEGGDRWGKHPLLNSWLYLGNGGRVAIAGYFLINVVPETWVRDRLVTFYMQEFLCK